MNDFDKRSWTLVNIHFNPIQVVNNKCERPKFNDRTVLPILT